MNNKNIKNNTELKLLILCFFPLYEKIIEDKKLCIIIKDKENPYENSLTSCDFDKKRKESIMYNDKSIILPNNLPVGLQHDFDEL